MEALFYQFVDRLPATFVPYKLFAGTDAPAFRAKIPAYLKDYLLQEAATAVTELEQGKGWPLLLASDYLRFSQDGNRVHFEKLFFKRRAILTLLSLAEFIEGEGKYLPQIADGIFLLCEESGWQLPAHNSYRRDAPQLPLPVTQLPVIDLFAAESAAELAVIYSLHKDRLDSIAPQLCARISFELERRIIRPYLDSHFWWMGNGDEPMCNWTPWITQNVLIAAFLTPQTDADRREILKKALYGLDSFLKDYGEDGCCSEGVEYYRHAGLCFYNAADIISAVTGGLTEELFSLPKIRNIAEYVVNMHVGGAREPFSPYFFNFADCSAAAGMSGCREYLFGKRVASRQLCDFAARCWKESGEREKLLGLSSSSEEGCNIFYLLQVLGNAAEIDSHEPEKKGDGAQDAKNIYYPSVGVFITNKGPYSLAVKSGGNDDSHNHNDTGSITLYKEGKPLLVDAGVGSYTKKTFSADRYSIWTMQSSYHNLPEIDGQMQEAGAEFHAKDVSIEGDSISQDIAPCYPADSRLSSYIRTVSCSAGGVQLCDRAAFTDGERHQILLNLMFSEKPELNSAQVKVGEKGLITIQSVDGNPAPSCEDMEMEEIPIDDQRLRRAWKGSLYRLRIKFTNEIHIEIR